MPPRSCVAFGPFVLDTAERRLLRDGAPVPLPPRQFDLLAALVAQAGRLVTRDEIIETVWHGVVVEENALSVAVSKLRAALGDSAPARAFIETVPRHGYRFVAPVTPCAPPDAQPAETPAAPAGPQRGWRWGAALLAAVVVVAAALVLSGRLPHAPGADAARDRPADAQTDRADGAAPPTRRAAVAAVERGRALWNTRRQWGEAYSQFRIARGLDSTYAPAYVGLADTYALQYRSADEADAMLDRALALDPRLADAYATRGFVHALQRWNWDAADAAFGQALALDARNTKALQWQATTQMIRRRPAEAERLLRRALQHQPRSASLWSDLCEVHYTARQFDAAEAACEQALALDPAFPFATPHLFWTAWLDGRPLDALRLVPPGTSTGEPIAPADLAGDGGADFLRWWLRQETFRSDQSYDLARAKRLALLGDADGALDALERAVAAHLFLAPFANADPAFDSLRRTPRFQQSMARMGLRAD